MPVTGPGSHGGWRRHWRICRNAEHAVYGAMPGAPAWQQIFNLGDGMKVKLTTPRFEPDTQFGGWQRRHAICHRQIVGGDITALLYPEVAQYLLDMACLRSATAGRNFEDVCGHVLDHYTPPDPRRYLGLVVNTMRLSASASGELQVSHACIGQRELELVDGVDITEAAFTYAAISPVPFMADWARVRLDAIETFDVEDWEITVENNITDAPFVWDNTLHPANGLLTGVRAHAIANRRTVSVGLTALNNDERFNERIRHCQNIAFEVIGHHPAGHLLQIQIPSLYVPESDEDGTPSRQATERPRLESIGDPDIWYGVDLAPGGTTTRKLLTTTPAPVAPTTTAAPVTTTTTAPA